MAEKQRGLVVRAQLLACGLTQHEIDWLVREQHWQQLQRGVYLTGSKPPDWHQRVLAAILAAGGDARASGWTAARIRQFDGAEKHAVIEITVSILRGPKPKGVIVRRSRRIRPEDRQCVDGIPVSSVNATLLEYAWLVPPILTERAVEDAIRRGQTTEGALRRFLGGCGKGVPGVTKLRNVLDGRPDGRPARTGFEVIVLDILRSAGLPLPTRRPLVDVGNGRKFELDLAYPHEHVDIEPKGRRWHSTARQRRQDAEREHVLRAQGWAIIDVWWEQAMDTPEQIVADVRAALRSVRS
jgi:hypothetical protein